MVIRFRVGSTPIRLPTNLLKQLFESRRKCQLRFVAFPKHVAGLLREIMKVDPYVASGGSGEVFPSNLPAFLR